MSAEIPDAVKLAEQTYGIGARLSRSVGHAMGLIDADEWLACERLALAESEAELARLLAGQDEREQRKGADVVAGTSETTGAAVPMLYNEREAARLLAMSPRQLWKLRRDGRIGYIQHGAKGVRYAAADLQEYIASQRRRTTATEGK